jgi:O-antigen/teichoic acid export membrane protein
MIESIRNFTQKNYVASSFVIYLIATIFLKGISFITTPIFTRIFSTSDYGLVSIFQTWVSFFSVFVGLQVSGSIATARVHKKSGNFDEYMKNITLLSLIGALIISSLGIIAKDPLSKLLNIEVSLIPHLFVQSYGMACATLYSTFTIQTKKPKQNALFSIIVSLSIVVLSLVLVLSSSQYNYLGKIYAGTIIYIFVIIFVFKRFVHVGKTKEKISDWKYAIALSAPLIIHLLSNIVVGQSDRIVLAKLIDNEATAIYSVAYIIGTLGMMVAEVSNKVWSPWYLDNTKASNNQQINIAAKKYIIAMSLAFVGVMLIAPEIIKIMAPKEYWSGISSLIIITASVFFQFLYRFPLAYEQYSRNLRWVAFSTVTSALINIGLNYLLIEIMGMVGAAVATFISYVILFAMHEFAARKIIRGYNINFSSYKSKIK